MKKSTTAVLLAALVLPGAGHLYLRQFLRGIALMAISLACLWIIGDSVMHQASVVLERLGSEGAIDAGQIPDLVTQSSDSAGSSLATVASFVFAGCWLVGIIDAYRLAKPG
jgi:hypothetical protein